MGFAPGQAFCPDSPLWVSHLGRIASKRRRRDVGTVKNMFPKPLVLLLVPLLFPFTVSYRESSENRQNRYLSGQNRRFLYCSTSVRVMRTALY